MIGERFKVSVFGESHGPAIGCTIEGAPHAFFLDVEELQKFLDRRAPGKSKTSTSRKEADKIEFLSGLNQDSCFEGTPITAIIRNTDTRSQDYSELFEVPRPGHADYAAMLKYRGCNDPRGGGHFSGRLTAPICIAGGIAKQILKHKFNCDIETKLEEVGGFLATLRDSSKVILEAKKAGDSVGAIVSCSVFNFPAKIGGPLFDGLEGKIAQAIFGIPAVKGIEFGSGFRGAKLRGSQNNDELFINGDGEVEAVSNNSGGILGGISTGLGPITFNVAFKPTPSISKPQMSVNMRTMESVKKLVVKGRHDPCVALRAMPVVEAATAIALYDAWLSESSR